MNISPSTQSQNVVAEKRFVENVRAELNRSFFEVVLDCFFEYRLIRDGCDAESVDRPVYMKRWFLVKNPGQESSGESTLHRPTIANLTRTRETNGKQHFIHKFLRSDQDRELHDHPWDFTAIILWRGYFEETERFKGIACELTKLERKRPGMILHRSADHRHRVQLIDGKPSWSYFMSGTKKRSWGFWRENVFIPWKEFVSKRCLELKGDAQEK